MKRLIAYWNSSSENFSRTEETWVYIIFPGLFTFLFLLFFQPFGVNNYDPSEKIRPLFFYSMFAMGGTVSLGLAFNQFVLRSLWNKLFFAHKKELLWIAWTLLFISALIFFFYNLMGNWHDFTWSSYFGFVGNISVMGILPFGIILAYFQFKKLSLETNTPTQVRASLPSSTLLRFCSTNGKDLLVIAEDEVVFIESMDNYAAIYYLTPQGLQKHLIRSSLKNLTLLLRGTSLLRCHRGFIVNLTQVRSWRGNKHGLMLRLNKVEREILVSRTYIEEIKAKLPSPADKRAIHP